MLEFKEVNKNMIVVVDKQLIDIPNGVIDNYAAGTWFYNSLSSQDLRQIADKLDELSK